MQSGGGSGVFGPWKPVFDKQDTPTVLRFEVQGTNELGFTTVPLYSYEQEFQGCITERYALKLERDYALDVDRRGGVRADGRYVGITTANRVDIELNIHYSTAVRLCNPPGDRLDGFTMIAADAGTMATSSASGDPVGAKLRPGPAARVPG